MGNYVDVKLQLDLTLRNILSAAGEVMIYLLMSNSRRELLRVTRGEQEEFCRGVCPLLLVKIKQLKTRAYSSLGSTSVHSAESH